MHWSKKGVQKMLDIRAIEKNNDWGGYKDFGSKEQNKLCKSVAT